MRFSAKQRRVLTWWRPGSPDRGYQAILCEGAVRSGKTLCTGLSFFCWAMSGFKEKNFALCGKTIQSVRRNLVAEVLPLLRGLGFRAEEKVSRNCLVVSQGRRRNTFYLFGGLDERSAALIQGITLAGALLDETVLMPRSFVEQTCARCSVTGSRIWFSCNPESPAHWFYREWVERAEEKGLLRLHFTMEDNPGLSPEVRRRYEAMFQGAFYRRYVLGEWVAAEGRVYDFFDDGYVQEAPPEEEIAEWYISCDYGTLNPTSMGLWGRRGNVWYRVKEYYYDGRAARAQKTDGEYADALERLAGGRPIRAVVADPSAASFLTELRRRGWRVRRADNQVLSGIRLTARLLKEGRLVICKGCDDAVREFSLYRWEDKGERDQPRKEHDHAMDEIRYFASTIVGRAAGTSPVCAGSVERKI